MTQDPEAERRSEKVSAFLQGLENYVTEVAKSNHGAKPDDVIITFKEAYMRSMLASAEYHQKLSDLYRKDGDEANANFHKLRSDIYRSIITK
jgi:hypothetical protein